MSTFVASVGYGAFRLANLLPTVHFAAMKFSDRLVPSPVGQHPTGNTPWFLVVGDSISAGISPEVIGKSQNFSYVAGIEATLKMDGLDWIPDDLACPTGNTFTYASGCPLAFTNPLLGSQPQRTVALRDIDSHRSTLKFILVELGSNDLFAFRDATGNVDSKLTAVVERLRGIVATLSAAAPGVPILIANFYDPYAAEKTSYAEEMSFLNAGIVELAASNGATVVDFATAMGTAGPTTKQQLCRLIACSSNDIHPTKLGEEHLAAAVMIALDKSGLLLPSMDIVAPLSTWEVG